MKKFSIQRAFAILLAMVMLAASLYTPDGAASAAAKSAKSIKSVKLKIGVRTVTKKSFTMIKGRTRQLKVIVKPASSKKSVTYRSTNSKIVSVSKKGNMKAKKYGAAKIIVKVVGKNGVSKKSWVKIKVSKKKTAGKPADEKDPDNPDTPSEPDTTDEPDTPNKPGTSGGSGTPGYSGGGSWGGSGGYRPGYSSDSSNDQKEITVSTQSELRAALRKQPEKVIFKTDKEVTVQIPEGTYNSTILVVDAPNATITNEAVYEKIQIKAIKPKTWIEKAIDNLIDVVAPDARIKVEAGAKAEIQINEGAGTVKVENEGTIGKFTLSAKAKLLISGNNQNHIPLTVDEKGKDATVNTSVPLDVMAQASIVLQLHSGAEKTSTIKVSNAGAMPTIVAAIWGCLQVTNLETGREDDVLVTMPKPDDPGFETAASSKEYGSVTGMVKSITADGTKTEPLQGAAVNVIPYERGILESDLEAAVRAAQSQNKCYTNSTSSEGKYAVDNIPYGNYVIVVKAEKLQTYLYTIILSEKSKQIDTITMVPLADGTGGVEGVIRDAFTGEPVTETMKLYLRKGAGTVAGEALKVTETGEGGKYSFTDLPIGVYTIRVVDERPSATGVENYINVTFNVIVLANTTIYQEMTITKAIAADQIRFVLRWGKESEEGARDLDSHLVGPKASESGIFHTYFGDKSYPQNTKDMEAGLDVDDVSWEGPETTTIYKKTDGEYHFYVYDYSEGWSRDNKKLAASQAKVDIYLGGRLLTSFNVPDGTGTLWDVCTYNTVSKELTPVNQVYDYPIEIGCEKIGLTEKIKESLSELISKYDGKETLYFGADAAAEVKTKIQEAKKSQESIKDFGGAVKCFTGLMQYIDGLFASTRIKAVDYEGARECNIYQHTLGGYSEIYLTGDTADFPAQLKFTFSSQNTTADPLENSEIQGYQKKVTVTNSITKVKEIYYIKYGKFVPDLNVSGIVAKGNKNMRWKIIGEIPDSNGDGTSKISILSVTGSALQLEDPVFTFYSSGIIKINPKYTQMDNQSGYVGRLEPTTENGDKKVYYVTYGSLLEPDNVTDGTNKINSWSAEHADITGGNINCIHIYGAESQLTTGAALEYNVTSGSAVKSTYEPMEKTSEGYVGKFTVSYNNSTKTYFVKYDQGLPELELIYVWEAKNSISSIKKLQEKFDGNAVYEVKGTGSELGACPSFVFNVNVKDVKVTPAGSSESRWNYKLDVTYENEVKTIYIKYTKAS